MIIELSMTVYLSLVYTLLITLYEQFQKSFIISNNDIEIAIFVYLQ